MTENKQFNCKLLICDAVGWKSLVRPKADSNCRPSDS
jgi:hypothetical protein